MHACNATHTPDIRLAVATYEVKVGVVKPITSSDVDNMQACARDADVTRPTGVVQVACSAPQLGRYVTIRYLSTLRKKGSGVPMRTLALCEVVPVARPGQQGSAIRKALPYSQLEEGRGGAMCIWIVITRHEVICAVESNLIVA